jgi:hypothetical protein
MILTRSLDAGSGIVTITARSETTAKHAFALAQTAVPPTSPGLPANLWAPDVAPRASYRIVSQTVPYPVTSDADSADIVAFSAVLDDGRTIDFPAGTVSSLTAGTEYVIIWSLTTSTYSAVLSPAIAALASSDNVLIRYVTTQNADGTYPGTPTAPGGDGGGGGGGRYNPNEAIP